MRALLARRRGHAAGARLPRSTGSSDLFDQRGRRPWASVNFVTAHDGFTLNDLVSYNDKHNEANGEDNRDGHSDNHSWNYGVEGPTDDPEINALRERQKRNMLATLLLSQGTPMMLAGDEFGRTQGGNNNAYCQDNEIAWIDWAGIGDEGRRLDRVHAPAAGICAAHPVLRRPVFLHGRKRRPSWRQGHHLVSAPGAPRRPASSGRTARPLHRHAAERRGRPLTCTPEGDPPPTTRLLIVLNAFHDRCRSRCPPFPAARRGVAC